MTSTDSPPIRLSLEKSVVSVRLSDLDSDLELSMFHRRGSQCSFTEEIVYDNYLLVLRLDWGDTHDGEPTLDLDAYRIKVDRTKTKIRPRGSAWHHTILDSSVQDATTPRTYDLEFEGLRLRLLARKTFATQLSLGAYIVDPDDPQGAE